MCYALATSIFPCLKYDCVDKKNKEKEKEEGFFQKYFLISLLSSSYDEETSLRSSLSRYRVKEVVYQRRHGIIFRAESDSTNNKVALKFTKVDSSLQIRMFSDAFLLQKEASEGFSLINQPHHFVICGPDDIDCVLDPDWLADIRINTQKRNAEIFFDTHRLSFDYCCLVTDYIPGQDLISWLQNKRTTGLISSTTLQFAFANLLLPLEHLHNKNIVHRDFKLCNFCFDNLTGYFKLIDFEFSTKVMTYHDQMLRGTPYYLAPDWLSGQFDLFHTDRWALGVCCYVMSEQGFPFSFPSEEQIDSQKNFFLECALIAKTGRISFSRKDFLPKSNPNSMIEGLLSRDPLSRWSFEKVKQDSFFEGFDWEAVRSQTLCSPFLPL